jgi:hypothetical protein
MNTKDIAEKNLIYKVRCGSHSYGTSLESSDIDYAGIFIPPIEYYLGLQSFDLLSEQSEEDHSYYSLRKYANLAVANNPNVLEALFCDKTDIVLATSAALILRENRYLFLSQRCQKTFVGYAKAQLHRIRRHTTWISQEVNAIKTLSPFLLRLKKDWCAWRFGENIIARLDKAYEYYPELKHRWNSKSDVIEKHALDVEVLPLLEDTGLVCPTKEDKKFYKMTQHGLVFQEHLYNEAKKKRDQYVTWMAERNPDRHKTELEFGYDTKHAMHLVRLLRMGYEVLTTGELVVRRPDANELLDIRAGKWTYEEVTRYADEMVEKIDVLDGRGFKVPANPDTKSIDKIIIEITKEHILG